VSYFINPILFVSNH